ncbi:hypothetical protein PInf_021616 [Phytophthora infestans]|nr:hypothetical protein PInf_021616 [Phytophthora infestans]
MTKKSRKEQRTELSLQSGDKKSKPLEVSILDTGDGRGLVATSADIRVTTGLTSTNQGDIEVMIGNDNNGGGDRPPASDSNADVALMTS